MIQKANLEQKNTKQYVHTNSTLHCDKERES